MITWTLLLCIILNITFIGGGYGGNQGGGGYNNFSVPPPNYQMGGGEGGSGPYSKPPPSYNKGGKTILEIILTWVTCAYIFLLKGYDSGNRGGSGSNSGGGGGWQDRGMGGGGGGYGYVPKLFLQLTNHKSKTLQVT